MKNHAVHGLNTERRPNIPGPRNKQMLSFRRIALSTARCIHACINRDRGKGRERERERDMSDFICSSWRNRFPFCLSEDSQIDSKRNPFPRCYLDSFYPVEYMYDSATLDALLLLASFRYVRKYIKLSLNYPKYQNLDVESHLRLETINRIRKCFR